MRLRRLLSTKLLKVVLGYEHVVIVTHDNPDPDAIATGWAVFWLIEQRLAKLPRLVGGGDIVRAENREMVRLLRPPIELVNDLEVPERTAIILVDCGYGADNHLLARVGLRPVAVIDHHPISGPRLPLPFQDIRPRVAASASIAASYLREQKLRPGPELAAALLYAIRTETTGGEIHHSRLEHALLPWLTARAEPDLVAKILNAPLSRDYYADLVLALQNTFVYEDAALCLLPRASGAEIVGEVADLLIRCDAISRVLCSAIVGEDLFVSVRTEPSSGHSATLVQAALQGFGHGGGHPRRAGGKVAQAVHGSRVDDHLLDRLRHQWLEACGVDQKRGVRLVAKREIMDNL